mmetsp:Transcript_9540/g.21669  ORF Transcript_9540/g.21669 Transcript_9540/m.21669 type:complete len:322 (-) Transcript_9540:139-1104(-)
MVLACKCLGALARPERRVHDPVGSRPPEVIGPSAHEVTEVDHKRILAGLVRHIQPRAVEELDLESSPTAPQDRKNAVVSVRGRSQLARRRGRAAVQLRIVEGPERGGVSVRLSRKPPLVFQLEGEREPLEQIRAQFFHRLEVGPPRSRHRHGPRRVPRQGHPRLGQVRPDAEKLFHVARFGAGFYLPQRRSFTVHVRLPLGERLPPVRQVAVREVVGHEQALPPRATPNLVLEREVKELPRGIPSGGDNPSVHTVVLDQEEAHLFACGPNARGDGPARLQRRPGRPQRPNVDDGDVGRGSWRGGGFTVVGAPAGPWVVAQK